MICFKFMWMLKYIHSVKDEWVGAKKFTFFKFNPGRGKRFWALQGQGAKNLAPQDSKFIQTISNHWLVSLLILKKRYVCKLQPCIKSSFKFFIEYNTVYTCRLNARLAFEFASSTFQFVSVFYNVQFIKGKLVAIMKCFNFVIFYDFPTLDC